MVYPHLLAGFLGIAQVSPPPPSDGPPHGRPPAEQRVIRVQADNTRIEHSCRVEIDPGAIIADADGNGVIHIAADNIVVEFSPAGPLRGNPEDTPPDQLSGIGIRIEGRRNVTIRGLHASGFKIGLLATKAPGLVVENAAFDGNFRQRLKSTPEAEDRADWLRPHRNDRQEWRATYGAAMCIEDSSGVIVRSVRVRRTQNGLLLDRVDAARVYDNDFSFLSGWGLALWRSSGNHISRNALDFCIRGYSHGVYNRGQDSAGLLMFEQCSANVIVENSATHGGDGLFGFAGLEAIGDEPAPAPFDYRRRGCNDNLIVGNDFSYAAAHGLEMTFSHGNRILGNRFVENGICGVWGGYSCDTLIAENTFERNGQASRNLERGGINIEHGSANLILENRFAGDRCGVHLWWDDDAELLQKPGVAANARGVNGNVIAANRFEGCELVLHLRDLSPARDRVTGTVFVANRISDCPRDRDLTEGVSLVTEGESPMYVVPTVEAIGESRPVGARAALAGRHQIVLTEWGPVDHEAAPPPR